MLKHRWSALALALVVFTSSASVMANPGNGNGGGHGNSANHGDNHGKGNSGKGHSDQGKKAKGGHDDLVAVNITYDRVRPLAVNYGLTGYQSLPPGIAKNLARASHYPQGLPRKWCLLQCWDNCHLILAMNGVSPGMI